MSIKDQAGHASEQRNLKRALVDSLLHDLVAAVIVGGMYTNPHPGGWDTKRAAEAAYDLAQEIIEHQSMTSSILEKLDL